MTGLDLETFLELLRADFGAWLSVGLVLLFFGLLAWTSWGSRRALRKCLVLSLVVHAGVMLFGSSQPVVVSLLSGDMSHLKPAEAVRRRVKVAPITETVGAGPDYAGRNLAKSGRSAVPWDLLPEKIALTPAPISAPRPRRVLSDYPNTATRQELSEVPVQSTSVELTTSLGDASTKLNLPDLIEPAFRPVPSGELPPVARSTPRTTSPTDNSAPTHGLERVRVRNPNPGANQPVDSQPKPPTLFDPEQVPEIPLSNLFSVNSTRIKPETTVPTRPASTPDEIAQPRPNRTRSTQTSSPSLISGRIGRDRIRTKDVAQEKALETGHARPSPVPIVGTSDLPDLAHQPAAPLITPASGRESGANPIPPLASRIASEPVAAQPSRMTTPTPRVQVAPTLPESDLRGLVRVDRGVAGRVAENLTHVGPPTASPLPAARVAPVGSGHLPAIRGATGLTRPLSDIPSVYRSRLDPNRTAVAQRAGATLESEEAVERALDWLSRHQDADGRWDGGTARYRDGSVAEGDDDYTIHCPPADVCFGPCYYWEGDTALTGLALLAYLGSGYTHTDGKYADTVGKGLDYLRFQQKPDGDLRGRSVAVGMYCHAMASLALCEAYALTGDPKLRVPVERAIAFLVRSRAQDGLAWRYAPGALVGDTSILGWAVMVLKSGKEVGVPIPPQITQGISEWLLRVSAGPSGGLAKYQPGEKITPTMTAEAWVCRQFLELRGGNRKDQESAALLLENSPAKGQFNLYYWYYGTLAMYQHGGSDWARWNQEMRDGIVKRQRSTGHAAGSWDPDESQYGTHGGRIYCTALATLSLEVYYRYLRLYDAPTPGGPRPVGADGTAVRGDRAP